MSLLTDELFNANSGHPPLEEYPWCTLADKLILWSKTQGDEHRAFAFDLLVSLAYIDSISHLQRHLSHVSNLPDGHNLHIGFINLCSPLLIEKNQWYYQKAAKPPSGMIGKLTSEIILRFLQLLHPGLHSVRTVGGSGLADAMLHHSDGRVILGEVKAAPLTTFPLLLSFSGNVAQVDPVMLTRSQVMEMKSALYMHCEHLIDLGKVKSELWPFEPAIAYVTDELNAARVQRIVTTWSRICSAYREKDRNSNLYYLANASGHLPAVAVSMFDWPKQESVSDSKTSVGMDRTDDIKKGIYQTFKLSLEANRACVQKEIRTAIISNLPAYRHGLEYVDPFSDVYWDFEPPASDPAPFAHNHRKKRPFDYIITLKDPFLRGEPL